MLNTRSFTFSQDILNKVAEIEAEVARRRGESSESDRVDSVNLQHIQSVNDLVNQHVELNRQQQNVAANIAHNEHMNFVNQHMNFVNSLHM